MGRITYHDRCEIFKFEHTGMIACLKEAIEFYEEELRMGRTWQATGYHQDANGDHVITLKRPS